MADHMKVTADALYEALALASSGPASGSMARADLDNTETRRGEQARPWGPEPVKTFHTLVSFTVVATPTTSAPRPRSSETTSTLGRWSWLGAPPRRPGAWHGSCLTVMT
jgi:hypothetical protein